MSILAAIDGERVPSNVVETGHELARETGEELVVLHVMPEEVFEKNQEATGDGTARSLPYIASEIIVSEPEDRTGDSGSAGSGSPYSVLDGEADAEAIAREVVDQTLDEQENVTIQGRVGEPVEEMLDEVDRRDARYMVIGGRKRTAVGKAIFGSITQSVLLNADIPVMTVMHEE